MLAHAPRSSLALCVLLLGLLGLFSACQSEQIDNTTLVDPGTDVSFSADVQPILTSSCGGAGCHIDQTTNGVNLSSYDQVISSVGLQYNQRIVIPGDGAGSPLVDKLGPRPEFGTRMPQNAAPLSNDQIALIRAWIDEGALDN